MGHCTNIGWYAHNQVAGTQKSSYGSILDVEARDEKPERGFFA